MKRLLPLLLYPVGAMLWGGCGSAHKPLFELLPPSETGITFANVITENARYNIIDFEYVYNGGGVALADMNGDGLQDIFFTGNQVDNALYLNRGDLHFEDITPAAGVAAPGKWCSGAALADVNNDGRMDIYVCANMELNAAARANLLYINQGNDAQGRPVFKDVAALCGVADTGYSTQAVFFDYDNDNDLDLYVVTNQVEGILPNNYRPKFVNGEAKNTDRLFRNEGLSADGLPRFTLVSREAGILKEGYGLSVAVVDINFDGWRDLYVTNDYLSDDLLWINQKDGTFKDEAARYLKHTCHSAMGNDVADINGDGLPDIVALDMLPNDNERRKRMIPANNYQRYVNNETYGYQYQYVRNMLQLHNGFLPETGEMLPFSDVGFLAGTFSTDWSWSSLMADFDNDGNRDLLITNGFPKDISDQDFGVYRSNTSRMRASKAEMIALIPEVKIPNYIFRNEGSFPLKDYTQEWGLAQPSFTNGAAYGDLDNDGDLDLVMNNIDDPAFVYRNTLSERKNDSTAWLRLRLTGEAQNPSAFGAKVWLYAAGKSWYQEYSPYRGYLSSVEPYLHVGLGKVAKLDSLRIIWPDGACEKKTDVSVNQVLELKRSDASGTCVPPLPVHKALFQSVAAASGLKYLHQEQDFVDFNIQRTLPHKLSEEGPQMCAGDVNGDGLEDLCIGASVGYNTTLFIQNTKGQFTRQEISEGRAKMQEDAGCLFFDADKDGDQDLYVVSGGYERPPGSPEYQDRLYLNDGKGRFSRDSLALPVEYNSGSCVKAADIDADGDLDLFVGGRVVPGAYPQAPSSQLLRNDTRPGGPARFTDITAEAAPALLKPGMVTDAIWADLDGNQTPDLMIAGEWMPLTVFLNEQGKLRDASIGSGLESSPGWWNRLAAADLDRDGDLDLVAGNLGLNSLCTATPREPMEIYAADFDNNQSVDPVMAIYTNNGPKGRGLYPMHTRDDLIKQLLIMRRRFPTYTGYGEALFTSLFTPEESGPALHLRATYMESSWVENLGPDAQGKVRFALHALPQAAQTAPLMGILPEDVDGDGWMDLLLTGNRFDTEVFAGRYDAFNGLVLQNDHQGGFAVLSPSATGFFVKGDARALLALEQAGGKRLYVASQNRDSLRVFTRISPPKTPLQ